MLPAYVLLAIVIGYGLGDPGNTSYKLLFTRYVLRVACLITVLLLFINHFPSFNWLHQNDDTRAYAESLLKSAPSNAIVLSNWHWANPLWYLQQVEGLRRDVQVDYVYPRGEPLATSWLNAIGDGLPTGRAVIVDMYFRNEFEASPYFFEPIGPAAFQVLPSPRTEPPGDFISSNSDFENKFRLVGYSTPVAAAPAGEALTILLTYRVEAQPDRDYSFFVHLVDASGQVIGQSDQTLQTTRYHVGDVIVARFFVAPLTTVPPGEYSLLAGIYSVSGDGQITSLNSAGSERVAITTAKVEAPDRLIDPSGIALSGGIRFLGSSASTTATLHPGDHLTLDLHFTAARPILRDLVVSVQLTGSGWRAVDDSVPALGAIPTLKWIAGSQITDRHELIVPQNATPGPAAVTLSLYDSFTQQPLSPLDAELIKQGLTIPLGTWSITGQ
jgi:hypothetical protein